MSQAQNMQSVFNKTDPAEECVTFFNTQRQARLTKEDISNNLHQLKNIITQLNFEDEDELFIQAYKGNTKSIASIESLLLRPHPGFFEGPGMYKTFENTLLPQLINQNSGQKKISLWIPGCTEGREAYSIALLLHAHTEKLKDWDISINATDIDNNALKKAETASFDIDDIDDVIFELYGHGLKKNGHEYMIQSSVRELITFQHNNFYDSLPPTDPYDVILFRNHLQYWQPDLQEKIIHNLENSLQLHGYLILSYNESLLGLSNKFKPVNNTQGFYQKIL